MNNGFTGNLPDFLIEREAYIVEANRLAKKVQEYKKQIKAGTFEFEIKWETDPEKIDLKKLNTSLVQAILDQFPTSYLIIELNLDKVITKLGSQKIFPTDNLWLKRKAIDMARIVEFGKRGERIIPPILIDEGEGLGIIDGRHRIALCRYLKLVTIPFIIKRNQVANVALLK